MDKRTIVTSITTSTFVVLLLYFFLPSNFFRHSNTGQDVESQYKKIQETKTLRAAYYPGAPLFQIDPNTKRKSGIFYEIVESAAGKLGLKVEWTEEVGYGEMIEGLNQRRYDIFGAGVWLNASRGARADFSIPVYYDAVYAYSRKDDYRFDDNLSIIDSPKYTISTMDGELGANIAKTDFPHASTAQIPQAADWSQLILNVINNKADVVFLALAPAREYQNANPDKIRSINNQPVRVFPVSLLIRKGEYELKQSLDAALIEMLTNGEIIQKNEKIHGSFLRTQLPYRDIKDK